eukprot:TRINITY_DN795_c0_g1_i5.p1 TRINITY_DN795_c0_g1~~TRINITY_DN795_c0_g1_i5.p1  ORF type:complete len:307 (-),score=45.75 TRINITY_DN795_c0_g1_i5:98-1018(-)
MVHLPSDVWSFGLQFLFLLLPSKSFLFLPRNLLQTNSEWIISSFHRPRLHHCFVGSRVSCRASFRCFHRLVHFHRNRIGLIAFRFAFFDTRTAEDHTANCASYGNFFDLLLHHLHRISGYCNCRCIVNGGMQSLLVLALDFDLLQQTHETQNPLVHQCLLCDRIVRPDSILHHPSSCIVGYSLCFTVGEVNGRAPSTLDVVILVADQLIFFPMNVQNVLKLIRSLSYEERKTSAPATTNTTTAAVTDASTVVVPKEKAKQREEVISSTPSSPLSSRSALAKKEPAKKTKQRPVVLGSASLNSNKNM